MNKRTREKLIKIANDLCKDMETHFLALGKMLGILTAFEHDLEEAKEINAAMVAEKERLEKIIESMK